MKRLQDHKVTTEFTGNPENTMNKALSNSVGMFLCRLMESYFPDASEALMDEMYETSLEEVKNLSEDDKLRQASIENFIQRANEPANMLDRITLYLPQHHEDSTGKSEEGADEVTYILRLKDVFTLVWKAVHDDNKFTQHYDGTPKEKFQKAKDDRVDRIGSFFSVLQVIESQKPCHQGVRHELVFLLNETYKDVHLIEDARSTIMSFLRENIHKKLWESFKTSAIDTAILKAALFTWMINADSKPILETLDPEKTIIPALKEYFIQHGISPYDIGLDTLIDQALFSLEFCGDSKYPILSDINWILNASSSEKDPGKHAALLKLQHQIKNNYQISNEADQNAIHNLYLVLQTHQKLERYHNLLVLTGNLENVQNFQEDCNAYFQAISAADDTSVPDIPEEVVTRVPEVNSLIEIAIQDTMSDQIENFFVNFFMAKNNEDEAGMQRCYAMLLDPTVQSKIILKDDVIDNFIQANTTTEGFIDMTPYYINRVLLHAIITKPQDWTSHFASTFNEVLTFIENNFNQEKSEQTSLLSKYSYPDVLKEQLDYLIMRYGEVHGHLDFTPERPLNMWFVLPHDVKTFREWERVWKLLDDEKFEQVYRPLAVKITHLLAHALEQGECSLFEACFFIPQEQDRQKFIFKHQGKIRNSHELARVLSAFPEDQRFEFAMIYRDRVESGYALFEVLNSLPEVQRCEFAKACQDKIRCAGSLAEVLKYFPPDQRLSFATEHQNKICDGDQLANILRPLPVGQRLAFAVSYQDKIKNGLALSKVLELLPESERLKFAEDSEKDFLCRFSYSLEVTSVIRALDIEDRFEFAMRYLEVIKTDKHYQFLMLLETLPEARQLEFALECNITSNIRNLIGLLGKLPAEDRPTYVEHYENQMGKIQYEQIETSKKSQLVRLLNLSSVGLQSGSDAPAGCTLFGNTGGGEPPILLVSARPISAIGGS